MLNIFQEHLYSKRLSKLNLKREEEENEKGKEILFHFNERDCRAEEDPR
jgi:hypothetical protein